MNFWQQKAETDLKGIRKRFQVQMAEFTTFKIGGPLDLLVEPSNKEELKRVLDFCRIEKVPWMVLGLGSNLLVRDKGIRGVGIKLSGIFGTWVIENEEITAGAGMALADLAKITACQGLAGLEFACGIPGTVGGAVYMNAGAYDGEMAVVVKKVEAVDPEIGPVCYEKAQLNMSYRYSRFQEGCQVITSVRFSLHRTLKETAEAKITELTCQRESKQPLDIPSAGSVFRRPPGYFVGPLIERSGLKGYSIGGAQISPKHAGFIVNTGGATCLDVINLIKHIQRVVSQKHGVELIPEVRIIGEE